MIWLNLVFTCNNLTTVLQKNIDQLLYIKNFKLHATCIIKKQHAHKNADNTKAWEITLAKVPYKVAKQQQRTSAGHAIVKYSCTIVRVKTVAKSEESIFN